MNNKIVKIEEIDELLPKAIETALTRKSISADVLQKQLQVGHPRAAKLIDIMAQLNFISKDELSVQRKVLITKQKYQEILKNGVQIA